MDYGGEEVRVHLPMDGADPVHGRAQFQVSGTQIGNLRFTIGKIHGASSFRVCSTKV